MRRALPASFRPPAVVWALTLLGFLMSVSSSLILPVYLGYDEPQHVDMVASVAWGHGWPGPGERQVAKGVAKGAEPYYGQQLKIRPLDKALVKIKPRGERPSTSELGGDFPSSGRPNQIVQHPPLYYALDAVVMASVNAQSWPYDQFVSMLRVLSALLVAPLPLLVWAIARRVRAGPSVEVAAAALSLTIPGLTRLSGLVNNDGFLIITTTALLLGLVHVATGDLRRRTAVVVGLLTGLALLSKGFALTLPVLVVLAYLLGSRSVRKLGPLLWALGVGFLTGGLWWVRNVLVYGSLQPQGFGAKTLATVQGNPRPPGSHIDASIFWTAVQDRLARTFWGGVGIASQPTLTKTGGTVLFVVLFVLIIAGLTVGVRGRGQRGSLTLLLLPLPLTLALVLRSSWSDFVHFNQASGLQGRYLYIAIAGYALSVALAGDRLLGPARLALPLLAVITMLLMQGMHANRMVRSLWLKNGQGSLRDALAGIEVLSPWPNAVTELVFAATVVTALAVLVLSARGAFARVARAEPAPSAAEPPNQLQPIE